MNLNAVICEPVDIAQKKAAWGKNTNRERIIHVSP